MPTTCLVDEISGVESRSESGSEELDPEEEVVSESERLDESERDRREVDDETPDKLSGMSASGIALGARIDFVCGVDGLEFTASRAGDSEA